MINHLLTRTLCRRHAQQFIKTVIKSATRKLSLFSTNGKGSLMKRPPVVTIMGHVDHGKTTLLDHLRNSKIVEQEFGGITQHIGAFMVPIKTKTNLELVTFIDTPGHAAFSSMRKRGANVTDIVVLVVACDDGILDQTVESINCAQSNQVPIIIAVNKIDKYNEPRQLEKQIELIRKQLVVHNVISEQDGGDTQLVQISALKGIGVENLKESILALAETMELYADPTCPVRGSVIESRVDPHRGKLCTVLVQEGTIRKGDVIVVGSYNYAKVRALFDERNQLRQECSPGLPIQVVGWREEELPSAGDTIVQVESEQVARKIVNEMKQQRLKEKAAFDAKVHAKRAEEHYKKYKEKLVEKRASGRKYGRVMFNPRGQRPKESEDDDSIRKISLILKCDVDGSLDALLDLLDTYDTDHRQLVKLDIIHYGVGSINETDFMLATSFKDCVIYGFNVNYADKKLPLRAQHEGVQVITTNIIYNLIDDLRARLTNKLPELEREVESCVATVLQEFIVKDGKKKTRVAGGRCNRGVLKKNICYRLMRHDQVVADQLVVKSLKHLKEEVAEIQKGSEFGISFVEETEEGSEEKQAVEFKPGDVLIGYEKQKYKPRLNWNIKGFV